MGKGYCRVYKYIQPNSLYKYHNSTFVVPLRLFFTSQHDSTNDCGVTVIVYNKSSFVSNITTTTHVDTDSNNDDDTHSVATLI